MHRGHEKSPVTPLGPYGRTRLPLEVQSPAPADGYRHIRVTPLRWGPQEHPRCAARFPVRVCLGSWESGNPYAAELTPDGHRGYSDVVDTPRRGPTTAGVGER